MESNKTKIIKNGAVLIGKYEDFSVYVTDRKSKTGRGKDRVWFRIMPNTKEWVQSAGMLYTRSADVEFTKEGMKLENERDWECGECRYKQSWGYEQLAESGTPQCPKCDDDMSLITEIK